MLSALHWCGGSTGMALRSRAPSSILVERVFDLLALLVFGIVVAVGGKLPSDIIGIPCE